ncbi:MAG: SET domain-containing protein [Bacteroidota bacterium]|nr:SET domain-containing protein [Bacteroidota bacterium]
MKEEIDTSNEINAPESTYLYTGPSKLPRSGNGLMTAIDIYKGEIIARYKGEILTDSVAKVRALKGEDQYFITLLDGRIMDSKKVKCFAKYANDATGYENSKVKNNASISLDEEGNVCLIATRKIKSGEEIFCSYGKSYWKKHG